MSEPIKRVIWSPDGDWAQWELLQCPVFEVFFGIVAVPGVRSLFWWHGRRRGDSGRVLS